MSKSLGDNRKLFGKSTTTSLINTSYTYSMPLFELDTFGAALKKYAIIGTIGFTIGVYAGYKWFHTDKKENLLHEYQEHRIERTPKQNHINNHDFFKRYE